jgi:hypothetical protein
LLFLDDDTETNGVIIKIIINLKMMCEEKFVDVTYCTLPVQNFVTEVDDEVSRGNYI